MPDPVDFARASKFIDLHTHTTASDGTLAPAELIAVAARSGVDALAITDHDTFDGYEDAREAAQHAGLELVRGIELNTRLNLGSDGTYRSVHLLGYWPSSEPSAEFREWLRSEREDRRDRNRRLIESLRKREIEITLEEVEALGRSLTGRNHFARVLVRKGYASNLDDAFVRYIGENAPSFVERQSQTTEEAIRRIRTGAGIPVIAHPIRLSLSRECEREVLAGLREAGLLGLEIYHSEHPPELQAHYRQLAQELDLLPTGGSDFHGLPKPDVHVGTGTNGNLRVPREFLDRLRQFVQ